jgi:hypothetical protein
MWEAIIGAAVALIGSLVASGKDAEAQRVREQMANEFGNNILPQLDKAVAQQAGKSAFETNAEDSTGRRAELDTLAQLDDAYRTGGSTDADLAAYDAARRKVSKAANSKAANAAMVATQRGQNNTGLGQVLAAQGSQDELESLASLDADLANAARGRAQQALLAKGQMAGQVRGDDWRALSTKLSAADVANRFNATQRQQAELINQNLPQQQYNNRLALLQARNAARLGVAQGLERQGNDARQTAGGLGQGAISFGSSWKDDEDNPHGDSGGSH